MPNPRALRLLLLGATIGCGGAFVAGIASASLVQALVGPEGPIWLLREPANAGLALCVYLLWRKWQAQSGSETPAWGLAPLGLALPALALMFMTWAGVARLTLGSPDVVMFIVSAFVLTLHGLAEEILMRGLIQRVGHSIWGAWGGIGLAGICFALLQSLQGYVGAWTMLNSLLLGLSLGFLALTSEGIWACVGAHAGWSWLETVLLGQKNQIIKQTHWLTGAGADSYGSPLFTMVLLLVLAAQAALHLRDQGRKMTP
ncbi:MAG: hypothetical protein RL186_801 [Pseudomonadota bacterium]